MGRSSAGHSSAAALAAIIGPKGPPVQSGPFVEMHGSVRPLPHGVKATSSPPIRQSRLPSRERPVASVSRTAPTYLDLRSPRRTPLPLISRASRQREPRRIIHQRQLVPPLLPVREPCMPHSANPSWLAPCGGGRCRRHAGRACWCARLPFRRGSRARTRGFTTGSGRPYRQTPDGGGMGEFLSATVTGRFETAQQARRRLRFGTAVGG